MAVFPPIPLLRHSSEPLQRPPITFFCGGPFLQQTVGRHGIHPITLPCCSFAKEAVGWDYYTIPKCVKLQNMSFYMALKSKLIKPILGRA